VSTAIVEIPDTERETELKHRVAHALCEALGKFSSNRAELVMTADVYVVPKHGNKYLLGTLTIGERVTLQ
jgi:hypothetical protein